MMNAHFGLRTWYPEYIYDSNKSEHTVQVYEYECIAAVRTDRC